MPDTRDAESLSTLSPVDVARPSGDDIDASSFPIVGVGASAGGLEAFTQLLQKLPLDTGMAFVLVQHLDPEHESVLATLLARATLLPVSNIEDNQAVEPNHVYVIPPDTNLTIVGGVLFLQQRQRTRGVHRPIDSFFESLAQDQRERAIGVVLSGSASDGTLGLEAIKAEGGITFAQDDSAKFDSMPRSAVSAGCVDLILSPANIALELARIATHPYVAGHPLGGFAPAASESPASPIEDLAAVGTPSDDDSDAGPRAGAQSEHKITGFKKVLWLLRNHTGVDFSLYKVATIQRRIARRLVLNKQPSVEAYADFLAGNVAELDLLYSDVLISVTSFFRNPEMFDVLQREVLPKLLKQRGSTSGDDPIRVWVLGCSTGQEAYSFAMSFVEALEKAPRMQNLQVFATDLNEKLLEKARLGLYAKGLANDITPQRLKRFFVEEEGGYRISKMLRDRVIFARQNLINDPPFSRMDLISCRNVLIYLEPSLQKKAMRTFHYALNPEGFLCLGASESVGGFTDLFESVDKKQKIYQRKPASTSAFYLPVRKSQRANGASDPRKPPLLLGQIEESPVRGELNAEREADRITINQFAPPAVLINDQLQVLQFRGLTGAYLETPVGKASFDVLKMARDGLMLPLRAAINQAKKENKTVRKQNVRVKCGGETRTVDIQVVAMKNLRERCFLILFEETLNAPRDGNGPPTAMVAANPEAVATGDRDESKRIAELESDLFDTREYLQSVQEQHEVASEEIQSANEEVQSANEELQSINEELETSKEELESANEELTTVNEEVSNRNSELTLANNDLINFQTSTKLAVMLLGRDLTVRRFSPQAQKQFDLVATDVGRSISRVRHNLVLASQDGESPLDLEAMLAEVISSEREQERQVKDKDGRWHSLRVRPYLTADNKIDGAVLVLVDIDALKRSKRAVAAARDYAENALETVREPLLVLDGQLRVESANRAFYRIFGVTQVETVGKLIYDVCDRQWNIPRLRELLTQILPQNTTVDDFPIEQHFAEIGHRSMLLNARRIIDPQHGSDRILLAIEDITERKRAEEALRESEHKRSEAEKRQSRALLQFALDSAQVGEWDLDLGTDTSRRSLRHDQAFGYDQPVQHWGFKTFIEHVHPDERADIERKFRDAVAQQKDWHFECRVIWPDGSIHWIELHGSHYRDEVGNTRRMLGIVRDITQRKESEKAVRDGEKRYRDLVAQVQDYAIFRTDAHGVAATWNEGVQRIFGFTENEFVGKDIARLIFTPEDVERGAPRQELDAAAANGSVSNDRWMIRKNGERFYVNGVTTVLKDHNGDVIGFTKVKRDQTDQKRTQIEMAASELRYRRLFEAAHDGILILDTKTHRITEVNPFMLDLLDQPRNHFVGKELWEIGIFHDRDASNHAMRELQEKGSVRYQDLPLQDRHGRRHTVEIVANAYQEDHQPVIQCNIRDISERKRFENEREAHLHNEQLLRMEAETANRAKDMFLATLSHEMRTPLNAIVGWMSILRGDTGAQRNEDELKEGLEVIDRNTRAQVQLIEDVLDVSRIVSGKLRLEMRPCDLASIIKSGLDAVRAAAEARSILLKVEIDSTASRATCDANRIQQVIWNLLSNAVKFTPRGGTVRVVLSREKSGLRIQVGDSGQGISRELLPYVFDRFRQADSSTRRRFGGLGLGLSIVKHLIEMHGGTVEADSPGEGLGATFTVHLPIRAVWVDEGDESRGANEAGEVTEVTASTLPLVRLDGLRVLVVDDEADARRLLVKLLEGVGAIVVAASSVTEALDALSTKPDVLVSDLGMPDQDGFDLIRQVRGLGHTAKDLPAVALTAFVQKEDRRQALLSGFQIHVSKPVDPYDLTAVIATLAGRKR